MNPSDPKIDVLFVVKKNMPYNGSVQSTISDGIHVDYSGGLTLEEYSQKKGVEFEAIRWEELQPRMETFYQSLITEPDEIDEDTYVDMLEVLPPCRYQMKDGITMFHMSERMIGTIVTWYVNFKNRYFSFVDYDFVDSAYLVNKIKKAI